MKTIEISVQAAPSFVQVFKFSPNVAAQALVDWIQAAVAGDEIVVKVGETEEAEDA